MHSFHAFLSEQKAVIDRTLDHLLPPAETRPQKLHEAMRYAVLSGGKRLRPALCLAACETAGGQQAQALETAAAIEMLHSYTLVHDDLPCMDNDDYRRGQLTCHRAFGEAVAVLTGDALLTLSFSLLARQPQAPLLIRQLADAAGSTGIIGGQTEDMDASRSSADPEHLDYIHLNKTARLFCASASMGAVCANASPAVQQALASFGQHIGMAFQLIDDMLDATSDTATLGKDAGSDAKNNKLTCVAIHGLDASGKKAAAYIAQARDALRDIEETQRLEQMADYIIQRIN